VIPSTFADVGTELISIIPGVLWVGFAALVVVLFRTEIKALLPRVESVTLPTGYQIRFREALKSAATTRKKDLSPGVPSWLTHRAERHADALVGARVLWVDDRPDRNTHERAAIEALGINVTTARWNEQAKPLVKHGAYDLVISDIERQNEAGSGTDLCDFVPESVPVVFYIGEPETDRALPKCAFGLTERPDELLEYVIDALTRSREARPVQPRG
jgi:CheY-like chemotaxis protein